jgi:hypothetical protein
VIKLKYIIGYGTGCWIGGFAGISDSIFQVSSSHSETLYAEAKVCFTGQAGFRLEKL